MGAVGDSEIRIVVVKSAVECTTMGYVQPGFWAHSPYTHLTIAFEDGYPCLGIGLQVQVVVAVGTKDPIVGVDRFVEDEFRTICINMRPTCILRSYVDVTIRRGGPVQKLSAIVAVGNGLSKCCGAQEAHE